MAKPRVLISSDIGGSDPDDIQSMVHALLYTDKYDLVGLVSSPTNHGGRASDIHKVIDAYAQDYGNLKTWSSDYPKPEYLSSIVKQGSIQAAPSKGWSNPTEGSNAIIKAAHASNEPLWVLTWGSMTDLAQALHDDPSIQGKLKVYSIGSWNTSQDPAARDYIFNNFKNLWWIENDSTFRGMYVDDSGNAQNAWKMSDAKDHGALGEHFHKAMPWGLKMGDTPSLLYLLDGADDNNPGASSWGGSFAKTGHGPNYWTDKTGSGDRLGHFPGADTVQNHQGAFYKDFAGRLDRAKSANPDSAPPVTEPTPPTTVDPTPPPTTDKPEAGVGTDAPVVAVDDAFWSIGVGETMWQNARYLTWNDKGVGELAVTSVASESAAGASVSFDSDGTIVYRPVPGWSGEDRVQYTVVSENGSTDTATFGVQVGRGGEVAAPSAMLPSDNGPVVAVDDKWTIEAGSAHYFNSRYLLVNDEPSVGGLSIKSIETSTAKGGTVTWNAQNGTTIYKPKAGFTGKDSVQYVVEDPAGNVDTAVIHFDVLLA